ncbi:hypothetical protein JCM10908_007275 [Rhodotorula pacifica]|uniref:uncharacterized protein n=1 Tax=Rhodotorula pacifica TaxID=1495444 RepID=UPI00316E23A1
MMQEKEPEQTLLDYTLRTAPLRVVYFSIAATGLGAAAGAASGVARNQPAIPTAFQASIKTGIFAFTFFSIREYGAIPLLTHFHLNPSPLPPPAGTPAPSPPSPHLHNLFPTAVAGLIAGSNFSYFQRPPATPFATHARAGVTLALGCTVLQGIVNELDVVRIRLLMWGEERRRIKRLEAGMTLPGGEEPQAAPAASTPTTVSASHSAISSTTATSAYSPAASTSSPLSDLTDINPRHPSTFSDPGRETFSERSDRLVSSGWHWFTNKLSVLAPLKRIDEAEYERRLDELLKARTDEREKVRSEIVQLEVVKKRLEERQREADEIASRA